MGYVPFSDKKKAMGFLTARQRPSCSNCAYGKQGSASKDDYYPWRCTRAGFGVTSQAVCNEHSPAQKGAAATLLDDDAAKDAP